MSIGYYNTQVEAKVSFKDDEGISDNIFKAICQRYYGRDSYEGRISPASIEEASALFATVYHRGTISVQTNMLLALEDKPKIIFKPVEDYYQTHPIELLGVEDFLSSYGKCDPRKLPKDTYDFNDLPLILNRHIPNPMAGNNNNNSIYIGRGTPYGNPFKARDYRTIPIKGLSEKKYFIQDREHAVLMFDRYLEDRPEHMEQAKKEIFGRNLMCSCAPKSCHCMCYFRLLYSDGSCFGRDTYFIRDLLLKTNPVKCLFCQSTNTVTRDHLRIPAKWQCRDCKQYFHAESMSGDPRYYDIKKHILDQVDPAVADRHLKNVRAGLRRDQLDPNCLYVAHRLDEKTRKPTGEQMYYY